MIERKLFGGTCVNTGCMPTKTLVASAYAAHLARRAADYGVTLGGPVAVDMKRSRRARTRSPATRARPGNLAGRHGGLHGASRPCPLRRPAHDARLARPLTAERIFLNIGGRASVPDMPGIDEVDYLTNTSMIELDMLPRHLVDRRRQLYRARIRADVPPLRRRSDASSRSSPRLIRREDEDVSAAIKAILENEGIAVHLDADCIGFAPQGNDIAVLDRSRQA